MDKKYFLNDGKKQLGPLSFEEISKMPLTETSKVWVEGSENWKEITEYEELRQFIIKMPPPIFKRDDKSKLVAREIKINSRLLLIALIVGIISYPIIAFIEGGFKSLSYKTKFEKLFKNYNISGTTTDTSSTEPNVDFVQKRDALITEVKDFIPEEDFAEADVQDYDHFNFERGMYNTKKLFDYPTSLDNNIKRSFGVDAIFLSVICFFLTSFILIFGRYLLKFLNKSINWVNVNASK